MMAIALLLKITHARSDYIITLANFLWRAPVPLNLILDQGSFCEVNLELILNMAEAKPGRAWPMAKADLTNTV